MSIQIEAVCSNPNGWTYQKMTSTDVTWYTQNGKYINRIGVDASDVVYIVGDWSWNRIHPDKYEMVDELLAKNRESLGWRRAAAR